MYEANTNKKKANILLSNPVFFKAKLYQMKTGNYKL